MSGLLPGGAELADLLGLLDVKWFSALVELQGGALQVHPQFRGPFRRGVGSRAPPDPVAKAFGMRLETQQARRVREHRPRIWLCEAFSPEKVEEHACVAPGHVGVALSLRRRVAKVAPSLDDLLGRSTADAELEAPAGNQIGRTGILSHVKRVLIAHIDHGCADLYAAGPGADRSQKRERRCELAGEVMHTEIRSVRAKFFGGDSQVYGLQERIGCRPCLRLVRGCPMSE